MDDRFYALGMFPYPSGTPHLGHVRVYGITSTATRHARLHGRRTLHPIGWDAFGLPAENAARAHGLDPARWTAQNIAQMRTTFQRMELGFDWDHELNTSEPAYYRWTQWLFGQLWRAGLAVEADGWVNHCDHCETVLADEQCSGGACWRCGTAVARRRQRQWTLKITDYAQRLWQDLERLEGWDRRAVATQRHWIGRSEGTVVHFGPLQTFTTRPETLFGVVAVVVAPEHPWAEDHDDPAVAAYVRDALATDAVQRAQRSPSGVPLGRTVPHPLTGEAVPVWVADYVIGGYGTSAVMCVPAHDERDGRLAAAVGLPIRSVIESDTLIDSGPFDGLSCAEARVRITEALQQADQGGPTTSFTLRDWSVGRQRRWGCPIPVVRCPSCGPVLVPDAQLPVLLDDPPSRACPSCGAQAPRETDTLDTFVCSAWYAFRFTDPRAADRPFDPAQASAWMPIDLYVGGLDHAAQHMLYFRFVTKVLHDLGHLSFDEPVQRFVCNGMVLGSDGRKMSKSRNNGVDPAQILDRVPPDALKLAILADNPIDRDLAWDPDRPEAKAAFLARLATRIDAFLATNPGPPQGADAWPDPRVHDQILGIVDRMDQALTGYALNVATALLHEAARAIRPLLDAGPQDAGAAHALLRAVLIAAWPLVPGWVEARWPERYGAIDHWPETTRRPEPEPLCTVQVDGRSVARLRLGLGLDEAEAAEAAMAVPTIAARVASRPLVRTVWIPGRILNLVCAAPS